MMVWNINCNIISFCGDSISTHAQQEEISKNLVEGGVFKIKLKICVFYYFRFVGGVLACISYFVGYGTPIF